MADSATDDMPEWLDPMVVKELRQGLRAHWFVIPFVAAHVLAVALLAVEALSATRPGAGGREWGEVLFWGLIYGIAGVALPARGLGSVSEEMDSGASQLIAVAGVSRWRMVVGKWLTQMVLAALLVGSLLPYAIVRYFFGGVELGPTAVRALGAVGVTCSMSALCLGASGYSRYALRAVIVLIALAYTGIALGTWLGIEEAFRSVGRFESPGTVIMFFSGFLGGVELFAFLTLAGLQLARARLRLSLRPWEVPPSRGIMILFVLAPFYFAIGAVISCGFGWGVFGALMVWWISSIDRPLRPKLRKYILPGTQPPPAVP